MVLYGIIRTTAYHSICFNLHADHDNMWPFLKKKIIYLFFSSFPWDAMAFAIDEP